MERTIDTLIRIREEMTSISTPNSTRNYSQNDTVLIIMNGRVEILDKTFFKNVCSVLANSFEVKPKTNKTEIK